MNATLNVSIILVVKKLLFGFIMTLNNIQRIKSGFTIIEVLVVIFIISVLIGVSAPSFIGVIRNAEINTSLTQVLSDLRKSQATSMAKGTRHGIRFTPGSGNYEMILYSESVEVIETRELPAKITVLDTTFTNEIVTFKRSGAPSEAGTITVQYDGGYNSVISVTAVTGKVKIE